MITTRLEELDYFHAQSLHYRWSRRKLIVVIFLTITAVILAWVLTDVIPLISCGIVAGLVGGAVAAPAVRYVYLPWKARRVFRQQKALQREFTLSWNADGLKRKSPNGEYSTAWSDFIRWKEDEHVFLVYLSDVTFYPILKRAFSPAELDNFRNQLVSGVPV